MKEVIFSKNSISISAFISPLREDETISIAKATIMIEMEGKKVVQEFIDSASISIVDCATINRKG